MTLNGLELLGISRDFADLGGNNGYTNEDSPVLSVSATELYSPLNVGYCSALYRLDNVDICWAFLRYWFAIGIQWVKWRFSTYIRKIHFANGYTTIIENRIFMICCRPTFFRYRAIIYTHRCRVLTYASATCISCYFRVQHSRA